MAKPLTQHDCTQHFGSSFTNPGVHRLSAQKPWSGTQEKLFTLFVMLAIASAICLHASAENQLEPFTLTTPSPVTEYSTVSKTHIHHLDQVFEKLGFRLVVIHNSSTQAAEAFTHGRYDGAILIEGTETLSTNLRVVPPVEHVEMGFFTRQGRLQNTNVGSIDRSLPNGARVAITENGLEILSQQLPKIRQKIVPVIASHPVQILRLVQSSRADFGFTSKTLFVSNYTDEHFGQEQFLFLPEQQVIRALNLYLHKDHLFIKTKLEQLLQKHYLPSISKRDQN